jgi:hypothetical protein
MVAWIFSQTNNEKLYLIGKMISWPKPSHNNDEETCPTRRRIFTYLHKLTLSGQIAEMFPSVCRRIVWANMSATIKKFTFFKLWIKLTLLVLMSTFFFTEYASKFRALQIPALHVHQEEFRVLRWSDHLWHQVKKKKPFSMRYLEIMNSCSQKNNDVVQRSRCRRNIWLSGRIIKNSYSSHGGLLEILNT